MNGRGRTSRRLLSDFLPPALTSPVKRHTNASRVLPPLRCARGETTSASACACAYILSHTLGRACSAVINCETIPIMKNILNKKKSNEAEGENWTNK